MIMRDKVIGIARTNCVARALWHVLSVSCSAKAGHPVFQRLLGKSSDVSGILDRPVEPGDDSRVCGKLFEFESAIFPRRPGEGRDP